MKRIDIIALILYSCIILPSHAQSKIARKDNYIHLTTKMNDCYCSTQNELKIPLSLNPKIYPYRGDFAKQSFDNLFNERINRHDFDSLSRQFGFDISQVSFYARYWDPKENDRNKKLVDLTIFRPFTKEVEFKFTSSLLDTITGQLNSLLIPYQQFKPLAFGKISTYPSLKSHWYQIFSFETRVSSSDMGTYYRVMHFFSWNKNSYVVAFNYNHYPDVSELAEIHTLLSNFGRPCNFKSFTADERAELVDMFDQLYNLSFEKLYSKLNSEEKNAVIECALEKLLQKYSAKDILEAKFEDSYFEEVLTGCIEYIKL